MGTGLRGMQKGEEIAKKKVKYPAVITKKIRTKRYSFSER